MSVTNPESLSELERLYLCTECENRSDPNDPADPDNGATEDPDDGAVEEPSENGAVEEPGENGAVEDPDEAVEEQETEDE